MNKVRIGNNVNVRWKVYNSNGSLYPIIGKIVGLYVSSASLEKVIDTYEIESRNELSFSLLAGELTRYGTYKLVLRLREGDSETEDATYDLVQMFQIVSKSYPERPNILDGEVNIEFSSVLNNLIVDRVEGMSAYEVAVAQGFTGTVSEWLASLQGEPGNDGSFWATYGTTKSVEIAAAIESGRSVFCNWNSLIYRLDKISFSQSSIYTFHVNSDAYQNSLTCQDDVWSHDEVKMATDAQVDEKTSVFFATYNSTTWQEINEAVTAGDAVFLKKDEDIYPLVGDGGVTPKLWEFAFVDTDLDHHRAVCHNDDTWQSTTKSLVTVIDLANKQDVISDLSAIRAGATLGATAYQKPSTGIPASDMASGVIPDISGKQDTLVSGSNIKTINGTSILGSGNIVVQTEITMDNVPTSGSNNPVKSGGLYTALAAKQNNLTFDNTPVASSNNPVKSGGLYTVLAEKIGSQDIDNVVELTLAQYNALATKDARTMYIVSDSAIPSDHVGVASLVQTTTSTADGGTNVWTCTLTNGQSFTLQVRNGNQGNSGYSGAAGELEVVNNLTDGGSTAALSAEMGKTLEGEISQLGLKVGDFSEFDTASYVTQSPTIVSNYWIKYDDTQGTSGTTKQYCSFPVVAGEKYKVSGRNVNTNFPGCRVRRSADSLNDLIISSSTASSFVDYEITIEHSGTMYINGETSSQTIVVKKYIVTPGSAEMAIDQVKGVTGDGEVAIGGEEDVTTEGTKTSGKYIKLDLTTTDSSDYEYVALSVQPGEKYYIEGWNINSNIPVCIFANSSASTSTRGMYDGSSIGMNGIVTVPANYDTMYVNGNVVQHVYVVIKRQVAGDNLTDAVKITDTNVASIPSTLAPLYVQLYERDGVYAGSDKAVTIEVARRFDETNDVVWRFENKTPTPNTFFDLRGVGIVPRGTSKIQDFICVSNLNYLTQATSDFICPLCVAAVNNADGDFPTNTSLFTGGAHGYNNSALSSASATMRQISRSVRLDGIPLSNGDRKYGHVLTIDVVNNIQGCNTEKENGSGREIIQQHIHVQVDRSNVNVGVTFTALEAVNVYAIEGLSQVFSFTGVRFIGSTTKRGLYTAGQRTVTEDKHTNTIRNSGDTYFFDVSMDRTFGLAQDGGMAEYNAMATVANKGYFHLIGDTPLALASGESVAIRGSYDFGKLPATS